LRCCSPAGAFYAFVACESLIGKTTTAGTLLQSDEDVALALLDEHGVATVHGSAFGLGPYLRLAYALDDAALESACVAIELFCSTLRSRKADRN
jgi:aspartate aminotransferase